VNVRLIGTTSLLVISLATNSFADPAAAKIMHRVVVKIQSTHTMSADITQRINGDDVIGPIAGHIDMEAPNKRFGDFWFYTPGKKLDHNPNHPQLIIGSDGKQAWSVDYEGTVHKSLGSKSIDSLPDIAVFIYTNLKQQEEAVMDNRVHVLPGQSLWEGEKYTVLSSIAPGANDEGGATKFFVYVGNDNLIHRLVQKNDHGIQMELCYRNIQLNKSPPLNRFSVYVPASAPTWKVQLADDRTKLDKKSKSLLKSAGDKIQSLQEISTDYTFKRSSLSQTGPYLTTITGRLKILRPGYIWTEQKKEEFSGRNQSTKTSQETNVCDGETRWHLTSTSDGATYTKYPEKWSLKFLINQSSVKPLRDYFDPDQSVFNIREGLDEIHYVGKFVWNGNTYDVLEGNRKDYIPPAGRSDYYGPDVKKVQFFIGKDKLIHRTITYLHGEQGASTTEECQLTNIDINPKLSSADFVFHAPTGAKLQDDSAALNQPSQVVNIKRFF
jgi:outer membrane lipoprotein-sorting protein